MIKLYNLVAINLLFVSLLISCKKGEPSIYLIPDGYKGAVEIVYDQDGSSIIYKNKSGGETSYTKQSGKEARYEGGSRVYEIPDSGILLTQHNENHGSYERAYFYVDNNGNRKKLKPISHSDIQSNNVKDWDELVVFDMGTGSYGHAISYERFMVASLNEIKTKFNKNYYSAFDKHVKDIIKFSDY